VNRFPPGTTIVGIAALVLGVVGIVGLLLTVSWLLGGNVPSVLPGVELNPELVDRHRGMAATAGLLNGVLSLLLVIFAFGLLRRHTWAFPFGRIWAWLMLPFSLFGAWVGWLNLRATDAGLQDTVTGIPLASADTARVTAVTGVVFGAALSWGIAFALLAWLHFSKRTEEVQA
jgi:hypothetical protein